MARETWVREVAGLMKSRSAISSLERPAPTSATTSRSRSVRSASRAVRGPAGAGRRAKASTTRRVTRYRGPDAEAALGPVAGRELAPQGGHALPHAVEATARRVGGRAAAVIDHLQLQGPAQEAAANGGAGPGPGVPGHVGQ